MSTHEPSLENDLSGGGGGAREGRGKQEHNLMMQSAMNRGKEWSTCKEVGCGGCIALHKSFAWGFILLANRDAQMLQPINSFHLHCIFHQRWHLLAMHVCMCAHTLDEVLSSASWACVRACVRERACGFVSARQFETTWPTSICKSLEHRFSTFVSSCFR